MSAKMKERVTVKRGKPDFKASDKLPKELGGTVESYASLARHWKQVIEKNHQWFDEDDKYKSSDWLQLKHDIAQRDILTPILFKCWWNNFKFYCTFYI